MLKLLGRALNQIRLFDSKKNYMGLLGKLKESLETDS